MPRLTNSVPKYRRHKCTGQAVVTLSGRDFYLGNYGSESSREEYDRLVEEWRAAGRRTPVGNDLTVAEVMARCLAFAKEY